MSEASPSIGNLDHGHAGSARALHKSSISTVRPQYFATCSTDVQAARAFLVLIDDRQKVLLSRDLESVSLAEGATALPLYTVMTQDGILSAEQRDLIAAELVRIHTSAMNVPAHFVHSVFPTYPRSQAYVVANRSPVASILAVIRAGHTSEEKAALVQALCKMFQDKTGNSDSDLSVALQEVPASQAMENGVIMPDVAKTSP